VSYELPRGTKIDGASDDQLLEEMALIRTMSRIPPSTDKRAPSTLSGRAFNPKELAKTAIR